MPLKIAFIAGIHGVGKSRLCSDISRKLQVTVTKASELITTRGNAPASLEKRVQNVTSNQELLVSALRVLKAEHPHLLDGHFCVIRHGDTVERISLGFFEQIRPVCTLVLEDDVKFIQQRLDGRDEKQFSLSLLNELQKAELEHAEFVCSSLRIPLKVIRPTDSAAATEYVSKHLEL